MLLRSLQNDEEFYPDTVVTGKNISSAGLDKFPKIEQMFRNGRVSNITKYFLLRTGEDGREGAQLARCGLNKDEAVKVKRTAITCRQLIEVHEEGMTAVEAAAVLGVNRGTVSKRWKRMGLKPLRDARSEKVPVSDGELIGRDERTLAAGGTPKAANTGRDGNRVLRPGYHSDKPIKKHITCQQLIEMHGKGMTVSEAAAVLEVSRGTVSKRWKRVDLKPLRDARSEKKSVSDGGLISGHERALVADDTPKAADTEMDNNRVLRSDHHSDRFIKKYINFLLRTGKYDEARIQLERHMLDKNKRKLATA